MPKRKVYLAPANLVVERGALSAVAKARYVVVSDNQIIVKFTDRRVLTVPINWYPRLKQGTPAERNDWELKRNRTWIHWGVLGEDISIEWLLKGWRSATVKKFERLQVVGK